MVQFDTIFRLIIICTICLFMSCCIFCDVIVIEEEGNPCTYFESARRSAPESSLVNCSWYASNACCKRTEVTSVFGGMYPLYGASKECSNQINYLMCYFCSPEQHRWYDKKARICEDYCLSVFDHCRTAEYNGTSLGERYSSGIEFCEGQRFEVSEGTHNCFKFDPTVFSEAHHIHPVTSYITSMLFFITINMVSVHV